MKAESRASKAEPRTRPSAVRRRGSVESDMKSVDSSLHQHPSPLVSVTSTFGECLHSTGFTRFHSSPSRLSEQLYAKLSVSQVFKKNPAEAFTGFHPLSASGKYIYSSFYYFEVLVIGKDI